MTLRGYYGASYGAVYGVAAFPGSPLPCQVALKLGGWEDVTPYVLQREGTTAPLVITRGRPDERSTVSSSSVRMQLNNRAGQFTARNPSGPYYGLIGRNSPVRVSVPASGAYLRMEDDSLSFAAMPGAGVLFPLSTDVRLDLTLTNWQPCTLASWWGAGGQRAWIVLLNDDGTISFCWSTDGTFPALQTAQSTAPLPYGPLVLRAAWNQANGSATFYTAAAGNIGGGPWTQLGSTTPVNGAAAMDNSAAYFSVGYNSAADADFGGMPGMNGQVRDALVSILGTIVAQPGFSSQDPGYATWTGAEGNNWAVSGTAEISDRSYRYHGEMSSLPQAWDPTGSDVYVSLAGGGVQRRIQQNSVPLPSPMSRSEAGMPGLAAWWPAEDTAGASWISPGISGGLPMHWDGKPSLAADTGFPGSLPIAQIQASRWYGQVGAYEDTGTLVFRFIANLPGPQTLLGGNIAMLHASGTARIIALQWSPLDIGGDLGTISAESWTSTLANAWSFAGLIAAVPPGRYLISLELTTSGGNVSPVLRVMNEQGSVVTATATAYSGSTGTVSQVVINPDTDPDLILGIGDGNPAGNGLPTASAGHITLQNTLVPLADVTDPFLAWNGETAADRYARLCAENSIACRITGYPAASIPMGVQGAATLSTLLQECETTDGGMQYEPRQCLGLGYRTRQSLYNQDPALTLDYSASELGLTGQPGELAPTDDDQLLINDIVAQRSSSGGPTGGTVRVTLDDGSPLSVSPPPDGVGDYQDTPSYNLRSDGQLLNRASWALAVGTANQQRIPSFPLNLARTELASLIYQIQDCELGDRVVVTSPPAWLPPDQISQLIAGCTESIGGFWDMVTWNTIPESPYEVFTVADPVLGRIGTAGSTLEMGISASALTFRAVSPGALWTTSGGDFPFDISVGGERMTVSGVSGSSSPQTFTISARSVNGVIKAQPANAAIALFTEPAVAL